MFPFKLHVPISTASLNVLFSHSSDHTHPKCLQFCIHRLNSVFLKKCTMQIYIHQVHVLFISAENTNPILLLQGHVTKILTTYPSPSSSFSSPPPLSCFQGLRLRDPFGFQHNRPEVSETDVLCSFLPAGLCFTAVCVSLDLPILLNTLYRYTFTVAEFPHSWLCWMFFKIS